MTYPWSYRNTFGVLSPLFNGVESSWVSVIFDVPLFVQITVILLMTVKRTWRGWVHSCNVSVFYRSVKLWKGHPLPFSTLHRLFRRTLSTRTERSRSHDTLDRINIKVPRQFLTYFSSIESLRPFRGSLTALNVDGSIQDPRPRLASSTTLEVNGFRWMSKLQ